MKIIFFGSDDFAAVHLEHLLDFGHEIVCCVTGPDKPQGRGMKIIISPIKQIAIDKKIPCLQPTTLKDKGVVDRLRTFGADVFAVVAYGRLLTQEILDIPSLLCLNVHGSLLPKYRGAAPVNWAILNGDKVTGVTIQKMALSLDTGDIIAQDVMNIEDGENAAQLRKRMSLVGARLLIKVLDQSTMGQISLSPQDESQATFAPKLTKEMGRINWNLQASQVINQLRGLQPWPGAYTFYNGKILKIIEADLVTDDSGLFKPGQVVSVDKSGFQVACSDRLISVRQIQPEAGKSMPAASFVAGYKIIPGIQLG